jgi:hypothetical protein
MAGILVLFQIIFIHIITNNGLELFRANADEYFMEEVLPIFKWIYLALTALVVLSSSLGMAFVGKIAGAKSFWIGLSRVLSILGIIITFGLAIILKYAIDPSDPLVGPVCDWLMSAGIVHAVNFVALFFRRKL